MESNKRNLILIVVLLILVIGIIIGRYLVQRPQILKPKAEENIPSLPSLPQPPQTLITAPSSATSGGQISPY